MKTSTFLALALLIIPTRFGPSAAWSQDSPPPPSRPVVEVGEPKDPAETAPGRAELVIDPAGLMSNVTGISFSPDGRSVAASGGTEVRIWDVRSGELRSTLRGEKTKAIPGLCNGVAWSRDGRLLIVPVQSLAPTGNIRAFDAATGAIYKVLAGHRGIATHVDISRDGSRLVTASAVIARDGRSHECDLIIWDSGTGKPVRKASVKTDHLDEVGFYLGAPETVVARFTGGTTGWCADERPEGIKAFAKTWARVIGDPKLAESIDTLAEADKYAIAASREVVRFAASADLSKVMARAGATRFAFNLLKDRVVRSGSGTHGGRDAYWAAAWEVTTDRLLGSYRGHVLHPTALAISPDGRVAASGDGTGDIHLWSVDTGRAIHVLRPDGHAIYQVAFTADGRRLAFGTTPFPTGRWNYNNYGAPERTFDLEARRIDQRVPENLAARVERLGELSLRFGATDEPPRQRLSVYRGQTKQAIAQIDDVLSYGMVRAPHFVDSPGIVCGTAGSMLSYYRSTNMDMIRQFYGHQGPIYSLSESPDGRLLATASGDRTMRIWSLEDWRPYGIVPFAYAPNDGLVTTLGDQAQAAGIEVGDRWVTIEGRPWAEFLSGVMDPTGWHLAPGQEATLAMERAGKPYQVRVRMELYNDAADPLLSLFIAKDGEWVLWTPQGYYDASTNGERLVGWHVNQGPVRAAKFYPAAQFRKQFFRPDVIARVLEAGDVGKAVARADAARGKGHELADLRRPGAIRKIEPPAVRILEPADGLRAEKPETTLRAEVWSQNDLPVGEVQVLLEGRPLPAASVRRTPGTGGHVVITADVPLRRGPNRLAVVARNSASRSEPRTIEVVHAPAGEDRPTAEAAATPEGTLHILAVGINDYPIAKMKLDVAAPDAKSLGESFQKNSRKLYREIKTRLLLDGKATRSNILAEIRGLSTSAKPGDLAVVFYAGHGVCQKDGEFFLFPHDAQISDLAKTGISGEDLKATLGELPCTSLLVLDACFSGSIDARSKGKKPALPRQADEFIRASNYESGLVVMCGAAREQKAGEGETNGLFTQALTEGMGGKADYNHDGRIVLLELQLYVNVRVLELSSGDQEPTISIPSIVKSFTLSAP